MQHVPASQRHEFRLKAVLRTSLARGKTACYRVHAMKKLVFGFLVEVWRIKNSMPMPQLCSATTKDHVRRQPASECARSIQPRL